MKERFAIIDGILCKRITRRTAQKLSETNDTPVYCFPVHANPASPFSVGIMMNYYNIEKVDFYARMFEFMYYNGNAQMGYYAAFYTPVVEG